MTQRALLLDFGGVLTPSVGRMFKAFEDAEELPRGTLSQVMGHAYGAGGNDSPIGRVERGDLPIPEFEQLLAEQLASLGHDISADDLVNRIFAGLDPHGRMWDAAVIARDAGVRTALLSNSWAVDGYPDDLLDRTFDDIVISAAVGVRKPDREIFELTADRLGVDLGACVFVDDLDANVAAARSYGLTAIHHDGDEDRVLAEVSAALDVDVTGARAYGR